jgi:hypothetical protein
MVIISGRTFNDLRGSLSNLVNEELGCLDQAFGEIVINLWNRELFLLGHRFTSSTSSIASTTGVTSN